MRIRRLKMQINAYVTKEMTIGDVVAKYPESAEIMLSYGLHCIGCHVNPYESIEQGSLGHGMDEETVDKMIEDVNAAIARQHNGTEFKPVILTDLAASKIKDLIEREGKKGYGLKVGAEPGGCSGFKYSLEFVKDAENSEVFEDKDVKIFVDKNSKMKLSGLEIDFMDGLHGTGFKISNPNAKSTCGCGESFN